MHPKNGSLRCDKKVGSCGGTSVGFLGILLLVASCFLGCGRSGPVKQPSIEYLLAAKEALESGDTAAAQEALDASIDSSPSTWAYIERAKLLAELGDTEAALADCEAGLELDPTHKDFKWLQTEFEKPADKRFKGRFAMPPSANK